MESIFNKFNIDKKLKAFIVLSLVVHLILLVSQAPSLDIKNALTSTEDATAIKIKLLVNSKTKRQIVQTQESKDKLEKKLKDAYLGKKDNFVARETKSARVGSFKSAAKGVKDGLKENKQQRSKVKKRKNFKDLKLSDLAVNPNFKRMDIAKKQATVSSQRKGLKNGTSKQAGLSRSNDFIKDVPLGDFTKLNTQEFAYYGFYHRIRQKLEQFWGVNIQEQAEKIMKSGRTIASGQNHLTSLIISLNSKGEIVKVKIKSTSGLKELDEAAVKSFNQAGPFPNPPKGMVKNGYAVIEWGFVVNT
tara:strand:- start:78006 stop:78914 length:909 start_codon:yes stop_codon:yes gene_type:complete